jgi:hypothetical protein
LKLLFNTLIIALASYRVRRACGRKKRTLKFVYVKILILNTFEIICDLTYIVIKVKILIKTFFFFFFFVDESNNFIKAQQPIQLLLQNKTTK